MSRSASVEASSVAELTPAAREELLAGRYRLLARVGRGGMADVFLGAADGPAGVNKLVVIKRLHDGFGEDPAYVTMFLDEARLSARMNHPNIVHTFEAERVGQEYIIVMEYLDGQPLRRLIKALRDRDERCPPGLAAHLMSEALHGLHYVHEMRDYDGTPLGIVHRDVSPQNLFVTYDGQLKVLDFGIAKATLNASDTQDGVVKGKFAYMSPEQANAAPLDRRADVFAAGVVLWELLTGKRLFHGENAGGQQNFEAPIPGPSSVTSAIPKELDQIVLKALARDPEARFASALDMAEALSSFTQSAGQNIRPHDVAHTMQNLFGDAREEMAKRILEYMTRRATEVVPFLDGLGDANPTRALPSTPRNGSPRATPLPAAQPPRRSRWAVGLGATLIAAVSSASAIAWRNAHPPAAAKVTARVSAAKGDDVDHSFHLALSSDPVEAQVTWDGKVVGQTPILIDLEPGPQTFVLSMPGHFNATVVVNVTPGMAGRTESRTAMMAARDEADAHAGDAPLAVAARAAAVDHARAKSAHDAAAPSGAVAAADAPDAPKQAPARETQLVAMNTTPASPPTAEARVAPAAPPSPAPAPVAWAPNVSTVLPFGPDMTRPTLLSGDPLIFPREAQLAHVSGAIIARCTITTEGALRSCRIIKGLPFLDQPILDSLATRRYTPVLAQGKPVSVQYVFNLKVESPS